MTARRLLYFLLALAGAVCLYCGLKIHRHIASDGTTQKESLTVGLAGSPLYTRQKEPGALNRRRRVPRRSPVILKSPTPSDPSSWHPVSASALLAVLGLALLFGAGRLRKTGD